MKKKILVVDDEEAVAELVQMMLAENDEYLVESTNDPHDAYKRAIRQHYDLIILDQCMVAMQGDMLYLSLGVDPDDNRKKRKLPKLLLISGQASDQELKKKLDFIGGGNVDYLRKPFDSATLSMKVAKVLWQNQPDNEIQSIS